MTVLLGPNDTGKSSVLKSLYAAFGADPPKVHDAWQNAEVTTLVRFQFGDREYLLLRSQAFFALFRGDGELVGTSSSIQYGLAEQLAELFGFTVRISSRDSEILIPPPAFFLLPFYMDQDSSWQGNWQSFADLGRFPTWRKDVVEYHIGLKSNEYYTLRASVQNAKRSLAKAAAELQALEQVRVQLLQVEMPPVFDADVASFEREIEDVLRRCNSIRAQETELREHLRELYSRRQELEEYRELMSRSIAELTDDAVYLSHELPPEVACPTCGTQFSNSLVEKFSLAHDAHLLSRFLAEVTVEIEDVEAEVNRARTRIEALVRDANAAEAIVTATSPEVDVPLLVKAEGRREIVEAFRTRIQDAQHAVRAAEVQFEERSKTLRKLKDKDRLQAIRKVYRETLMRFLAILNVKLIDPKVTRAFDATITETGSDLPRALLAYYFTILHVISRFSDGALFPIVIDEPNQQAQDPENLRRIFEFIRDEAPAGAQVIMATEHLAGIDYPGKEIALMDDRLLTSREYDEVAAVINPLLQASLLL